MFYVWEFAIPIKNPQLRKTDRLKVIVTFIFKTKEGIFSEISDLYTETLLFCIGGSSTLTYEKWTGTNG
jgi:hypothetical protein